MFYEMSMNQNGNDIVNNNVCGSQKKPIVHSNIHTDRHTMAVEVNKLIFFALTAHPFGTSFAKHV